jgi:hypothetical protein
LIKTETAKKDAVTEQRAFRNTVIALLIAIIVAILFPHFAIAALIVYLIINVIYVVGIIIYCIARATFEGIQSIFKSIRGILPIRRHAIKHHTHYPVLMIGDTLAIVSSMLIVIGALMYLLAYD